MSRAARGFFFAGGIRFPIRLVTVLMEAGVLLLEQALTRVVESRSGGPSLPAPKAKIKLSRRESQIVRFIAIGLRNFEIAERLGIGEQTVKNHLHNIFQKTRVRDRLDLALFAVFHGLHGA